MNYTKCKDHFGHIALAVPVVNCIRLKKTQMDSEAYLQEMQEDNDNEATSLDQKLQAGCIVFSLFSPTNIR